MIDFQEILESVRTNAPVDRAGFLLIEAANEYPQLFDAIINNLDAPPEAVMKQISAVFPLATIITFSSNWREWIINLQKFFKEAQKNGKI